MPNWCNNYLQIEGDYTELKKFYDENFDDDEGLQFCKSVPMPKEEEDNWYNWNCENWGTKWEIDDCIFELEENDTLIAVNFQTAWAPPEAWLRTVCGLYPKLSFELRFAECGMDFSGYVQCEVGEVVHEENGENGDFYGWKFCANCEDEFNYDELERNWDSTLCMCVECRDNAFKLISNFIREQKIKNLPKKMACMRMGRNPIVDKYLLNKVYIPRMCEIVS